MLELTYVELEILQTAINHYEDYEFEFPDSEKHILGELNSKIDYELETKGKENNINIFWDKLQESVVLKNYPYTLGEKEELFDNLNDFFKDK
jgi:hypothetical protein